MPELDTETINAVLRVIEEELRKYQAGSEAAAALWALKERLSD